MWGPQLAEILYTLPGNILLKFDNFYVRFYHKPDIRGELMVKSHTPFGKVMDPQKCTTPLDLMCHNFKTTISE